MKFSINSGELQHAVTVVSKGSSARASLPILAGILVRAENDAVTLEATNLDLSIRCTLPALVEAEGSTVIPARLFGDVLKSLPDSAVHLSTDDGNDSIAILCESSSFSLRTLDPQDFPGFPEVATGAAITVPFAQFSQMVRRVGKIVSRDESRAVLTGVLVEAESGTLRMVATDSYRLAITEAPHEGEASFSAVISGSFMGDLAALEMSDDAIEIALAENQIVARYGNTTFINRRIEGTFPRYQQLLPDGYTTRALYATKQLADAVKRTSLLSNKTAPVKFDLNGASQTTQISTASQDIGAAAETLRSGIEGADTQIAFNFGFVIDGLAACAGDNVYLELQGPMKPGIFRAAAPEENYTYLIMPVRMS